MSPALYKVGEPIGPFEVILDEFTTLRDGRTVERVVDSGGNQRVMFAREDDRTYHPVMLPERHGGVVVPYTKREKRTVHSVPPTAEWVYVGDSPYDYWRVLCDYWTPEHDLILCEHDVQWRSDISRGFDDCPELWCNHKYCEHSPESAEAWKWLLGCTRFRKELIAAVPDAVTSIEPRHRDWHYTCDGLGANLEAAGFKHHWHEPVVHHQCRDKH